MADSEWPTHQQELTRKAVDLIRDRLARLETGELGIQDLRLIARTLFDTISGLVEREVADAIYAVRQEMEEKLQRLTGYEWVIVETARMHDWNLHRKEADTLFFRRATPFGPFEMPVRAEAVDPKVHYSKALDVVLGMNAQLAASLRAMIAARKAASS